MRISDWSSDVCSSDLLTRIAPNVDISGGIAGQFQGQISIRGISTLVRNIGLETGVGIYVDGVYVVRPENFDQHLLRSEEHTSELQSLMRISYAVFCLKKKK